MNFSAESTGSKPVILIFPHNLLSHYLRCLKLAKYFSSHYKVIFQSSHKYNKFIKKAGFGTFDCNCLDAEEVTIQVNSFRFNWLRSGKLEPIFNAQVAVINQLKPAAVLGDFSPTVKMAAEKTGVLYYALFNGYLSPYYAGIRGMPKSYQLYPLFKFLPPLILNFFTSIGEKIYFRDLHQPFDKIRKANNLSLKRSYEEELNGDINLVCDLPELFPQKELPSNYLIIPPLYHEEEAELNDIKEKLDKGKKTLFVTMGSSGEWDKATFLNDLSFIDYNIIAVGDLQGKLTRPNIIKVDFINIHSIFSKVDLVICHGGNGTIYQALSYGIPLLCLPSHFEQQWNVEAIERLSLGKSIEDVTSITKLKQLVEEWIPRKDNKELLQIKRKIREANAGIEASLNQAIFYKEFSKKETLEINPVSTGNYNPFKLIMRWFN